MSDRVDVLVVGAGGKTVSRATARLIRGRNVVATALLHQASRRWPERVAGYPREQVSRQLRQGARRPWRTRNNYLIDLSAMLLGRIDDGSVPFARRKVGA